MEGIMQKQISASCAVLAVVVGSCCSGAVAADGAAAGTQSIAKNLSDQKFEPVPGVPACLTSAVLSGDPGKGPALLLAKFTSGCTVPWHWHTPDEHVMLASGVGKMEMKDAKAVVLRAGGYAEMPSHHVHQFTCVSACVMFLRSDGIFDTHYVNADGKEIALDEALKKKK
jgi:quercetin dioxygenase-like cupin family protein